MNMQRTLALMVLGLATCGCSDTGQNPFEGEISRLEAQLVAKSAAIATAEETTTRLEHEVRDLMGKYATLQDLVEMLKLKEEPCAGLAEARAEAARWRAGLEKAVEELNDQQSQRQLEKLIAAASSRGGGGGGSSTRSGDGGPRDSWVSVRQPYVVVTGDAVEVQGTLHNLNSQPISGFLLLTVTVDGLETDAASLQLDIPANTVIDYDHAFYGLQAEGQTVRVTGEWDKER